MTWCVDSHAADPADKLVRGRPLLPRFLDQDAGRVDTLIRLAFSVQYQYGESSFRCPAGAGQAGETRADHCDVVGPGLDHEGFKRSKASRAC